MDTDTYAKIRSFAAKFLSSKHQGIHAEDLTQYLAMKHFECGGNRRWKHICIDYFRINGIVTNRSKHGAIALGIALSIDAPSSRGEGKDSMYLLDQESILKSENKGNNGNNGNKIKDRLELFLSPLSLNNEVMKWAIKSYKVKTSLK